MDAAAWNRRTEWCSLHHAATRASVWNDRRACRHTERLRITPGPLHSDADIDALVAALGSLWQRCALARNVAVA